MYSLRMLSYAFVLILLGSEVGRAQQIWINGLKGVPRFGNNKCWTDTGGRVKNVCPATELLSFMPDLDVAGRTVVSTVYSDAMFGPNVSPLLQCQNVALSTNAFNYWSVGPWMSNGPNPQGTSLVTLPSWQPPWTYNLYQIDCQVPSGVQVFGVSIAVY
jgi:hypothetical protein